jgi:hypothetical protein
MVAKPTISKRGGKAPGTGRVEVEKLVAVRCCEVAPVDRHAPWRFD